MKKTFFEKINANENVTIDFLGDSITLGTIHCKKEEAYVAKFAAYLAREISTHTVYRYDGIPIAGSAEPMKCFEGPVLCAVGDGEGKNWWCVMYPPLCLDIACEDAPSDDGIIGYTDEEYALIKDGEYQIKFKILELFSDTFSKNG